MKRLAPWIAFLALVTPLPAQDAPGEELQRELDRIARGALDAGAQGLVLAIDVGGGLAYARGFGVSDPARGTPADPAASFRAGALCGPFLAVTALRLAERGALELQAPLSRYLPGLYAGEERVTIDRLLTHTSGIPAYGTLLESVHHLAKPFEAEPVLDWLAGAPLESEPGSCASYSNTNDFLLGLVLEKVAGTSVPELLEREVFAPAGMEDTSFCFEHPTLREAAHVDQEFAAGAADLGGAPPPFGAEGLCTNALDLLRFQRALGSGALLGAEQRARRVEPAVLTGGGPCAAGRGVNLTRLGDLERHTLGGGMAGFRAHLAWYPSLGASVVVLASGLDAPVESVERTAVRILFDLELALPRDLALAAEERSPYLGDYYAGCTSFGVTEEGTRLVLVLPGDEHRLLLNQGDDRFVARDDPDLRVVFEREGGRPAALHLTQHGITLRAARIR